MTPVPARVVSVNVGTARDVPWGTLRRSAIDKQPVTGLVRVHTLGIEGDEQADTEHHGGVDQAVYAYADPEARRWADELGRELDYGWFGENLRIDGMAVSDALVGERWEVGTDGLVLEVTIPRVPCKTFAVWAGEPRWMKRFLAQADFGTYLRVVRNGTVAQGDRITVVHRPDHGVRSRDLLAGGDVAAIRSLLAQDDLPAKVRREATKMVNRSERPVGAATQAGQHKS